MVERVCVGCLHVYMYTTLTFSSIRLGDQTNDANKPRASRHAIHL
jgi:hypothetical protein